MRLYRILTLLVGLTALISLESCSRESPIKENVSLKNNHSRVFALREPFQDPQAFTDSIANTTLDKSDTLADTLTVTINDTVYLMGILPKNVDKIYRFQWNLTKSDGKDSIILGNNAKPQPWVYTKEGVYYPLFIAFDGNNATDTAGTDTKRTYIRVINTKPRLVVPKDTLWTKHDGDITFPIFAQDTFGFIESIKLDLDASGKDEPKSWEFEKREDNDSLYVTIKQDPEKVDSLGNQKIYVIVKDDDGNEVKDSVNLHFNRIPRLKIVSPLDGSRHSSNDRFFFYYEAEDDDNPQNLQYYIYAQVSKNGQPPQKAFTSEDLIAKAHTSNIFEPTDVNGNNIITLVDKPSMVLSGRIYWDMYVTDGYDIVHMERIKTGDETSRPWNFYLGDLSTKQGRFTGVAKLQGRTNHSGINMEFSTLTKSASATTDEQGNYSVYADEGAYTATATPTAKEYEAVTIEDLWAESGISTILEEIVLKDTVKPSLQVRFADTLKVRQWNQTVYARDFGAYIDTVTATYDGAAHKMNCLRDGDSVSICELPLANMLDGEHKLVYSTKDRAGNEETFNQTLVIQGTSMKLLVNGQLKDKIKENGKLVFEAEVINAYPTADSITWTWKLDAETHTKRTAVTDGKASLTIDYSEISTLHPENDYKMEASYKSNGADVSAQVMFGIRGDKPTIFFTKPSFMDTVTLNDEVEFNVVAYEGKETTSMTINWSCNVPLATGYTCPAKDATEGTMAFKQPGSFDIIVFVIDDLGNSSSDRVTIVVVPDPPTIKASTNSKTNEFKINSEVEVTIAASDKRGTVNEIQWGCSNGTISFDEGKSIQPPSANVNTTVKVNMPGKEADGKTFSCLFKAVDDDGESSYDSVAFFPLLDPPTVHLATKADTVKIKSNVFVEAIANDKLGRIEKYEYFCNDDQKQLATPDWTAMAGAKDSIRMPEEATKAYYCMVQVTDDDGNTAVDTAVYTVLVGRPTVTAILPNTYKTVTIKDKVELNAIAMDSLGTLVKYEWGCGSAATENIGFTFTSTASPKASMVMPDTPQDNYRCIIRVTDDDNNKVNDTVSINIILAPPTVTVNNDTLTIREGYNIALGANAYDDNGIASASDPGEITKREWSCGLPDQIESNWKAVTSFDTVWKAPAPNAYFICVARATDNDGNTAYDTTQFNFSTELPLIWVKEETIYLNNGDPFTLSADVNDVWQGINWFSWECVEKETGKSMENSVIKYSYKDNKKSLTVPKDSSYSEKGKDMYCIVSAEEASTKVTFKDTTTVHILEQHPQGIITAPDTVYLWSGDESVDDEALYFYDKRINGSSSKMGELGNKDMQLFRWRFSNLDNGYYEGNPDGTMDTSRSQFNSAFIRRTKEGSMTIYLDYRDSTTDLYSQGFLNRHRAEEVSRKIYFSKAWKNLATADTVLETTRMGTAPTMALVGSTPVVAYLFNATTVKVTYLKNGSWTSLGSVTAADSVIAIQLASNGEDLFMGIQDKFGNFTTHKSPKATSDFAKLGSALPSVVNAKLLCNPKNSEPIVLYVRSSDNLNYLASLNGTEWKSTAVLPTKNGDKVVKFREINGVFSSTGLLTIVAIDNSSDYSAYSGLLAADYKTLQDSRRINKFVNKVSLSADGSNVYMGFVNRSVYNYGPCLYKGTIGTNTVSWDTTGVFQTPIFEGYIAYHVSVATHNGVVYAALDDNGRADYSQSHVFRLEGGKWHFHGENQLPYFNTVFYNNNKYYLRGHAPQLAIDGEGKVYLSLLARENAGGSGNNNGPIIMKYVADNWEIH